MKEFPEQRNSRKKRAKESGGGRVPGAPTYRSLAAEEFPDSAFGDSSQSLSDGYRKGSAHWLWEPGAWAALLHEGPLSRSKLEVGGTAVRGQG